MKIELNGRKALVTGSTAGIGRAIAEGLARAGASVVINGRTKERVDTAIKELRALLPNAEFVGVVADVATAEGSASLEAQAKDVDILVNNAGTAYPKGFFEQNDVDWLNLYQLNVMSGVRASRHYMPGMIQRGWGRVVFISSESAIAVPKEMIDYAVTKTAQLALSRGLAELAKGTGVTVNAVLPGPHALRNHGQLDEGGSEGARHYPGRGRAKLPEHDPTIHAHQPFRNHRRSGQHGRLRVLGAVFCHDRLFAASGWGRCPLHHLTVMPVPASVLVPSVWRRRSADSSALPPRRAASRPRSASLQGSGTRPL